MATPNIVPRADSEGNLGTADKFWLKAFLDSLAIGKNTGGEIVFTPEAGDTVQLVAGAGGAFGITTIDGGGALGHITLAADGNIILDAAGDIALEAAGNDVTVDTDNFTIESSALDKPLLTVKNTNTGRLSSGELKFLKDAADVVDGEQIGLVSFYGDNDAGTPEVIQYAQIVSEVSDMTDGQEAGDMYLKVASYDGVLTNGLYLDGDTNADGEVDVTIASGAASTTTIAGTLTTVASATLASLVCTAGATFGGGSGDTGATITTEGIGTFDGALKSRTGTVTGVNYRTMYIDAGGMVPAVTNGAIANTEEMHATNFTTLDFLSFSTSTEQYADFKIVMPEQYNNGTIKAKFYWKPADAEASVSVVWGIKAYAATDSNALTGASGVWGTEQVIEDVSLNTVDDLHISDATPAITIAGTPAEGKLVFVRVFRKVAAGDDDYADAAELLGVNLQYQESFNPSAAW